MRGLKHIDDEIIELSYKKNISEDKDLDLEIGTLDPGAVPGTSTNFTGVN